MRIRSWRGSTTVSSSSPKRGFPWARVLLIVGILAILAYIFLPGFFYISADALVQGNLVPVAPLYRVRIDRLLVACDDHVDAGQRLAVVSNFLVQADYQRQYLQSVSDLQLSKIALDEHVLTAKENAETLHEKYLAAAIDAERLGNTFASYDQAYRGGAVPRVDWDNKRNEWQAAAALARSDYQAWQRAAQAVEKVGYDQTAKINSDKQLSQQAQDLATRTGSEALRAPVSGYIVDCVDRPQNVIEPSTPIFNIFEPNRAYVLAYFDPGAVEKVHLGQQVNVTIAGVSGRLTGTVGAIYPTLSKLPPELTRFFWQHVQWSEFRPVKILLDNVPAKQRQQLYYGAQARVTLGLNDHSKAANE